MCISVCLSVYEIAREETRCRHMCYSFRLAAKVLYYASSQTEDNTYHGLCYTSRGALAGTRNRRRILYITKNKFSVTVYDIKEDKIERFVLRIFLHPTIVCLYIRERSLMVRWVVGSILHGVEPLSYFSFQPVLHDWCHKGRGMCYHVCGMVHIKGPLLLIEKSSPCGGSGFPLSLSEWSFTISPTPYNCK